MAKPRGKCAMCGDDFDRDGSYTAYSTSLDTQKTKPIKVCRDCFLMLARDDDGDEEREA